MNAGYEAVQLADKGSGMKAGRVVKEVSTNLAIDVVFIAAEANKNGDDADFAEFLTNMRGLLADISEEGRMQKALNGKERLVFRLGRGRCDHRTAGSSAVLLAERCSLLLSSVLCCSLLFSSLLCSPTFHHPVTSGGADTTSAQSAGPTRHRSTQTTWTRASKPTAARCFQSTERTETRSSSSSRPR